MDRDSPFLMLKALGIKTPKVGNVRPALFLASNVASMFTGGIMIERNTRFEL